MYILNNLKKYVIIPNKIVFIRHAVLCKKSTIYNYTQFFVL